MPRLTPPAPVWPRRTSRAPRSATKPEKLVSKKGGAQMVAALFVSQDPSRNEGATMTTRIKTTESTPRARRDGFTLIELLIVVVIVGLLAAIAIPKFSNTKGKAAASGMRSDLRNLASAQENYWNDNGTYYMGPLPAAGLMFQPTQGVGLTITDGTAVGWSAT